MDVMCLGIVTCDILVKVTADDILQKDTTHADSISLHTGGDALNVAVALKRMGVRSGICGKTGKDYYGSFIRDTALREGVDTSFLKEDGAEATSACVVIVSGQGKRNFIYDPGATAGFTKEDAAFDRWDQVKVLAIGSYFSLPSFLPEQMKELLTAAREKGILTVLDVTNNPGAAQLPALACFLPWVDYFMPSLEEAAALSGCEEPEGMADFFRKMGAGTVVIKMGEEGSYGTDGAQKLRIPATPDQPVDTTGAGDCFVAGMIAAVIRGYSLKEAMIFASRAAGQSVTGIGAVSAVGTFEEISQRHDGYCKNGVGQASVQEEFAGENNYHVI